MKKILCILLVAALSLFTLTGCISSETPDESAAPVESAEVAESSAPSEAPVSAVSEIPIDTLMVGTSSMSGDFISGFGNNAYDMSVQALTAGYMHTYELSPDGEIILNETVVSNVEISLDDIGNKTYAFTLHDDLYWNNGDKITARDYVASVLWSSSPEWVTAGASTSSYKGLLGYSAYFTGESTTFEGVSLISDLQFSITIPAESLPFFWETVHAMILPIHFDTYLPSAEIVSDANGSSLSFSEGDLLTNCERIASTERFAPTVTCGPYSFSSFENDTLTLEKNEYFKGDYMGNKPSFQYVVQKVIPLETSVEWVINGEVDIVEGIVGIDMIEAAKASDAVNVREYLRAGYGYLALLCDEGPTADVNVRWALASLIDRNAVVDHVLGGYGTTVDAEYGLGQWMYIERGADLQQELLPISFNIDTANNYLDESEWIYEADGSTPFDRTKVSEDGSYLRHNAAGEPLTINYLAMDNIATDITEIQYTANAPLAGMDFNVDTGEWSSVLENYYYSFELGEDRIYNAFGLATNFSAVFDRHSQWHSDFVGTTQNSGQLSDPELDAAIMAMRELEPTQTEEYLDAWMQYQIRWNELMPQVPLYSNENFDISHVSVNGLETTAYAKYYNIICQISKG